MYRWKIAQQTKCLGYWLFLFAHVTSSGCNERAPAPSTSQRAECTTAQKYTPPEASNLSFEDCYQRIHHENMIARRRSLQELQMLGLQGRKAWSEVRNLLDTPERRVCNERQVLRTYRAVLADSSEKMWPIYIDSLCIPIAAEHHAEVFPQATTWLLIALGREGPAAGGLRSERLAESIACGADPEVDELLEPKLVSAAIQEYFQRGDLPESVRAAARVALWCIGAPSEESRVEQLAQIMKTGGEEAEATILALSAIAVLPSDAPILIPALEAVAKDLEGFSADSRFLAVVALGCGFEASRSKVLPIVRSIQEQYQDKPDRQGQRLCASFALAKLTADPDELRAAIRLAAGAGEMPSFPDGHTGYAVFSEIADALVTDQMRKELAVLLKDGDPRVRAGALNMVAFVGRSMRDTTSTIMKALREDSIPEMRVIAARTLAFVADDSILPDLQELRKKSADKDLQDALKEAIDILRAY